MSSDETIRWITGIDPGVHGAIAFVGSNGAIEIIDMPTVVVRSKTEVDEHALARLFDDRASQIVSCWIERTWARPGEGPSNVAAQVGNYQFLRGVIRANFISLNEVSPQRWKRDMQVDKGKDASRVRCSQLLPTHTSLWPLKKHDGRCDALLIALFGARVEPGFIEPYPKRGTTAKVSEVA